MLTNAIKYRKHGRELIVDIKTWREQEFVILEHADNGLGLDLNKYGDRLFKMHQRFHGKAEGNGLGLYIVKKQLESLQGMIEADSAPDEGMKFKLYLKDQEIVNE
jgi:light-regulated signal transduction histidine kinase (bacteriophytochrome)